MNKQKLKAQKKTERYAHFPNTIVPAFPLFSSRKALRMFRLHACAYLSTLKQHGRDVTETAMPPNLFILSTYF